MVVIRHFPGPAPQPADFANQRPEKSTKKLRSQSSPSPPPVSAPCRYRPWPWGLCEPTEGTKTDERLSAGEPWEDQGLVFASAVGTPLDPSNLRKVFDKAVTNAGVGRWFAYLTRHTAVPLLLDAGKSIEVIADLLGDDPRTVYRDRPGR